MILAIIEVLKVATIPPPVVVTTMVKRKSQKSNYQKSNYRSDGCRTKKYHGADRKNKSRAASSRIDSPPEEILLIGDSMLRNIDPDGYKQAVWLFSYPGINAFQV